MSPRLLAIVILSTTLWAPLVRAQQAPAATDLYGRVSPSLVVVQYTWETELGRRELEGVGIVVSSDGLVMTPIALFDLRIPDAQMRDFKVLIPRQDGEPDEFEAVFLGRDERSDVALMKVKQPQGWPVVQFVDEPLALGEALTSIGLMPEEAGFKPYLMRATVAAQLRGETPYIMVSGDLGGVGAPVFDDEGKAVGFVNAQQNASTFLNDGNALNNVLARSPRLFVPTRDFAISLDAPPTEGNPIRIPWLGVPQQTMNGLNKDLAEMLGIGEETPALELGDIVPDSPAHKAGLGSGTIVLKVNGKPLVRGDAPEELPGIFIKQLRRIGVDKPVTLTVIRKPGAEPEDVTVTLEQRPKVPSEVDRYWAEDLGFGARELTFADTYTRRLASGAPGVVVTLLKPNGSAANAQLQQNDLITEVNGEAVGNLEQFEALYERIRKTNANDAVVMVVQRDAGTAVIRIEPPQ